MKGKIAAILMLAALGGTATAVPVPPPPGTIVQAPNWIAGSEWYYSDGYALKVSSVSPQSTVFDRIDAPGQWFSRAGFVRKDLVSATATRNGIYRTIGDRDGFTLSAATPLTFQREYLSNGKLMVHASSWTVEGRETITVPAGTFDCWLIVWRTRSLNSDWTGFERWWYSPQAQHYVRMEYKYGPGEEGSRVLMRYTIGPPVVPVAQAAAAVAVAQVSAPVPLTKTPDVVATPRSAAPPSEPKPAAMAAVEKPVPIVTQALPAVPKDAPQTPRLAVAIPASNGGLWHAQVGSSKDAAAMRASLQKMLTDNPKLAALPNGITAHEVEGRGTFYRAWLGAFDKPADAKALCNAVSAKNGCAVFKAQSREARND